MDQTAANIKIGTILGYIAGSLVILSNLFQIAKMIKEKNGLGLSPIYLGLFFVVCCLYVSSGFLIGIQFVYIINIINLAELITMIFLRFYFQKVITNAFDVIESFIIKKSDFDQYKTIDIIPLLEYTITNPQNIKNVDCVVIAGNVICILY